MFLVCPMHRCCNESNSFKLHGLSGGTSHLQPHMYDEGNGFASTSFDVCKRLGLHLSQPECQQGMPWKIPVLPISLDKMTNNCLTDLELEVETW